MSQVFFFNYAEDTNPLKGLQRLIAKSTFEELIPRGKSVAIKLHM